MTLILGIETSCDETAAAVVDDHQRVLGSVVWSQHELHQRYRGVVPEIASRAHLEKIHPIVSETLEQAGITFDRIDAIAVGNRPGLIGSLIVGVAAAKALAWSLDKPLIGVDHVEAHLHAAQLCDADEPRPAPGSGPALGLVVSGGHTSLYFMPGHGKRDVLGRTIDDAIGEAFDKAAVILDAGYPGGPAIDRLAGQGDPSAVDLPRSTLGADSLDFSFSGLKTALLYAVRGRPQGRGKAARFPHTAEDLTDQRRADLAASFQAAAIDAVMIKLARALDQLTAQNNRPNSLVIGGGVSANSLLRDRAKTFCEQQQLTLAMPKLAHCVDNAAMIAGFAHHAYQARQFDSLDLPAIATTKA